MNAPTPETIMTSHPSVRILAGTLCLLGALASHPALADHGPRGPAFHGHPGGHWVEHNRGPYWSGWWIGSPWFFYPPPYPNPPIIVQTPAPEPVVVQAAPQPVQHWYYCESAKTYYPYVQNCPEGWRSVAAVPPTANSASPAPGTAPRSSWYYCESAQAYYPYARRCPEGWRAVPANPPTGDQP